MFSNTKRYKVLTKSFTGKTELYIYASGRRDATLQAANGLEKKYPDFTITIEHSSRKRISIFGTNRNGVVELVTEVVLDEEELYE